MLGEAITPVLHHSGSFDPGTHSGGYDAFGNAFGPTYYVKHLTVQVMVGLG